MSDWQDISTAPTDGTRVLIYLAGTEMDVGYWAEGRWWSQAADEMDMWGVFPPTHWRALPEPPEAETQ